MRSVIYSDEKSFELVGTATDVFLTRVLAPQDGSEYFTVFEMDEGIKNRLEKLTDKDFYTDWDKNESFADDLKSFISKIPNGRKLLIQDDFLPKSSKNEVVKLINGDLSLKDAWTTVYK